MEERRASQLFNSLYFVRHHALSKTFLLTAYFIPLRTREPCNPRGFRGQEFRIKADLHVVPRNHPSISWIPPYSIRTGQDSITSDAKRMWKYRSRELQVKKWPPRANIPDTEQWNERLSRRIFPRIFLGFS